MKLSTQLKTDIKINVTKRKRNRSSRGSQKMKKDILKAYKSPDSSAVVRAPEFITPPRERK